MKTMHTIILALIAVVALPRDIRAQQAPAQALFNLDEDADVGAILKLYTAHSGKKIIQAKGLPLTEQIKFDGQYQGTNEEILVLLEALLVQHGVAIIPFSTRLVKAVSTASAHKEALAFSRGASGDLPEADRYITKIVKVKHVSPRDLKNFLESMGRMPKSVETFEASKTIIIRDFASNVKRMMETIEEVDQLATIEEQMQIIPIRYADVVDVAEAISTLTENPISAGAASRGRSSTSSSRGLSSGSRSSSMRPQTTSSRTSSSRGSTTRTSGTSSRGVVGQGAPLLGDTRILAYPRNNSVIVIANEINMVKVQEMVDKLDVVQPQVLIEAIIMDVVLADGLSYGLSIKEDKQNVTGDFSSALGMKHGGNFFTTNSINALNSAGLNYWGFINQNWEAAVQAIATDTRYDVLSRPRIQTSHAEQAVLFVGETRPYVTGTTSDINGGTRSTYEPTEIGITLDVMPYINPDGLVVMDILQEISEIAGTEVIDGNNVPIMTKREARAKVAVRSGEVIALGGFIKTKKTKIRSGVPILKDVPLLGALFRSTDDSSVRKELIVLMRPKVLPNPEAAAEEAKRMKQGLPAVLAAEHDENQLEKELFERNKKLGIRPKNPSDGRIEEPNTPVLPPPLPLP